MLRLNISTVKASAFAKTISELVKKEVRKRFRIRVKGILVKNRLCFRDINVRECCISPTLDVSATDVDSGIRIRCKGFCWLVILKDFKLRTNLNFVRKDVQNLSNDVDKIGTANQCEVYNRTLL